MIRWMQRKRSDRPANCREVAGLLQPYLDGEIDELTARRIADHLEDCRRCGLEASTYTEIKNSLKRRQTVDPATVERLREFGTQLAEGADDEPDTQGSRE